MKKGVSPVIAVVLLIAITVIAAMGLWYWSTAFTAKPNVGQQYQISLSYTRCNGTHVLVRNNGGVTATRDANIFNSSGQQAGYLNFSGNSLASGAVGFIQICNATGPCLPLTGAPLSGVFNVLDPDYASATFSC